MTDKTTLDRVREWCLAEQRGYARSNMGQSDGFRNGALSTIGHVLAIIDADDASAILAADDVGA